MHLVADMAVPEHTRNDGHPFSPGIEAYVEERLGKDRNSFDSALGRPYFFDFKTLQTTPSAFAARGAPIPLANLFDRDLYFGTNPEITTGNKIGLAEYTNANFLSTDTNPVDADVAIPPLLTSTTPKVFAITHPLGYPEKVHRWYHVKNRDGETGGDDGYKLTAMSVLSFYRQTLFGESLLATIPILDEPVYEDYARLLLPRAVGYAATALNYFFRGDIELSLPEQGFYSIATDEREGFHQIRVQARNVTVNEEEMPAGSIELVVRHKTALQDPFQGIPVPVSENFSYIVAQEANGVRSIPQGSPVELVFSLPEEIPLNATDVTLQVVYHGRLGFQTVAGYVGENQGVGVGFLDISEPTVVDYINSMDVVCVNGEILPAGSEDALNALDAQEKKISSYLDLFAHDIVDSFLKYSPQNKISYASPLHYDATLSRVPAGHYARHFVLTEPHGTYVRINDQMQIAKKDPRDTFLHLASRRTFFLQGMINQEIMEDGVRTRYYCHGE
ncbi:hypothetical protein [Geoalkalibacter sp.]|uniref:hypothetical protein n=1 Tax=Geoalkalibacter sp. TaxID=3041440 RepID=UPI00272E8256|nr:hypothetical protein [Geoalkalibacter sp.]